MLCGRDAERAALRAVLDGARASRSGVLVLRGEPGVGKSALLADLIAAGGDGVRVLRVAGVQAESELAFAGLHQIVWPLLTQLDDIPAPQAAALRSALGLETSTGENRFLIGAAVLSLLAAAAEAMPILCVVDDAHWLDEPSADALTFAARRLHAERIAMLFAARSGDARTFPAPGLPELRLEGLDPEASRALLREHADPALTGEVRERLVHETGGNPLALLELPPMLAEKRLTAGDRLPLTRGVEAVFLGRARDLPAASQRLLLIAAADDTGDPAVVLRAARSVGIEAAELDTIEAAGLLRVRERGIEFRHPLVRSAVYQGASFGERQAAHRALADTLGEERYRDRQIWHRAAANLGPDDELADQLDGSAERARRRSGYAAAATALERAASFTSDDERRSRRLAAAARAAWLGGRPEWAVALVDSARQLPVDPRVRADLDHLRALIELQCGSPARAHEILLDAATAIVTIDPDRAAEMLVPAGEAAHFAGDLAGEIEAGRRAEKLRTQLPGDRFELTMMAGIANVLGGDVAQGAALLRQALTQAASSANPRRFTWAGSTAYYLGDINQARAFWSRSVDAARSQGEIAMLALALEHFGFCDVMGGRFATAGVSASEGLRLAGETGQPNSGAFHSAVLGWIAARSGREEECRARAAETFDAAAARGLGIQAAIATLALGELELSLGRPAEALGRLESLWSGGPGASSVGITLIAVPDLVEAAVRAGRPEKARLPLAGYADWVSTTNSPLELPLLARCRALLSDGAAAARHFQHAVELHADVDRPFERARTELLFGEFLRRNRRPGEAREHLRSALEASEQLGAALWAEQASAELRASGVTARRRDPGAAEQLTPQELQIARFVAEGASNKTVAAQLFLSPRTIEFHLRNIFIKLGITSRTQLASLGLTLEPAGAATA